MIKEPSHNRRPRRTQRALAALGQAASRSATRVLDAPGGLLEVGMKRQTVDNMNQVFSSARAYGGEIPKGYAQRLDLHITPLATQETHGAGYKERDELIELVHAGNTVYGIVRETGIGPSNSRQVKRVKVVELPFGHNIRLAADPRDNAPRRVVGEISMDDVKANEEGYVMIVVGRNLDTRDGIEPDNEQSQKHFSVMVSKYGPEEVVITDMQSTNGTTFLNADIIHGMQQQGGSSKMPKPVTELVASLNVTPSRWDSSQAGMAVFLQ